MSSTQSGILLISDITGYTTYLNASELEHAQDSLRSLLALLVDHTQSPLIISRLEGDAVISYALEGSFQQGQTIVELIERTYLDFRRALNLMVLNTTCTCMACRNISNLDLKFIVHYGTFVLEPLHTYTELVGSDVNVVHRLTKNSVAEGTGITAYVLYTQAAVDALGINEIAKRMVMRTESPQDFGELTTYVQDMHAVWEAEQGRTTRSVKQEESEFMHEIDLPLAKAQLWDVVTRPENVAIINASDTARVEGKKNGRIGVDAAYYCAHGKSVSRQTIVDWQPPDEYTHATDLPFNTCVLTTTRLSPIRNGTRLTFLWAMDDRGHPIARQAMVTVFRLIGFKEAKKNIGRLQEQITFDLEAGATLPPTGRTVSGDELEAAARESLKVD
jgi:class 3 adenylate cyclase